jgi:hypothetical protein
MLYEALGVTAIETRHDSKQSNVLLRRENDFPCCSAARSHLRAGQRSSYKALGKPLPAGSLLEVPVRTGTFPLARCIYIGEPQTGSVDAQ